MAKTSCASKASSASKLHSRRSGNRHVHVDVSAGRKIKLDFNEAIGRADSACGNDTRAGAEARVHARLAFAASGWKLIVNAEACRVVSGFDRLEDVVTVALASAAGPPVRRAVPRGCVAQKPTRIPRQVVVPQ